MRAPPNRAPDTRPGTTGKRHRGCKPQGRSARQREQQHTESNTREWCQLHAHALMKGTSLGGQRGGGPSSLWQVPNR
jgi:hypothetical protein